MSHRTRERPAECLASLSHSTMIDKIKATLIKVSGKRSDITIAAVYCPPKHQILREDYRHFFSQLGHRYIIGGDWNAKHLFWGSKLVTTRGRHLYQAVKELNLECVSTEETQLTVSLKTVEEVEQAIEDINKLIHSAANRSTPQGKAGRSKEHVYPTFIRDSVTERRRLRREWQNNHYARDKTAFNKASQQLKALTKE
ncbi:RNA-directed DNA polymerase from mobile element jockey [Eumeta japonica]|uniref:RNA-directed DNA polymerase from mobile element jockey n=1 Tax=Eumeta variegata TaxID=151549 RepID=A0A4C1UYK8_EUMVA|nr:RNA-directed DNA polymerase from mobile element jockey [Eumeta japonica]